jgi:hypothetical protein
MSSDATQEPVRTAGGVAGPDPKSRYDMLTRSPQVLTDASPGRLPWAEATAHTTFTYLRSTGPLR